MKLLEDAGIYVIADLSEPGLSIIRDDPAWTTDLFKRYTSVIDVMAKYDNTFGFFAGNEVSNQPNNTDASAFVKAAVRDSKRYIKQMNYREMGVGYATNDDAEIREDMAAYFDCGTKEESIDFWGYNVYSWCGDDSSFQKSGYDVRTKEFEKYDVPVFFAEYGCNTPRPRFFGDVEALYGDDMNGVWSGGIVYMYFEEENEFGLVKIDNNEVERLPDFTSLSSQLAKVTPTGVQMADYNPTNTAKSACPSVGEWAAEATPLPPQPNDQLCKCMYDSLTCVVNDSVDEEDYGDLFGIVCGLKDGEACRGIAKNATTGVYGAYGMCNAKEQLGFALNQYAKSQLDGNGCNFSGSARATQAKATQASECRALVSQAGSAGTGTVTSVPTGAGGSNNGPAATSSKGAAGVLSVPRFESGMLQLGAYLFVAGVSGMAMILL